MIGISDLSDGATPAQVRDDIALMIDQLRDANEHVRIHLSEVLYSNTVAFNKVDELTINSDDSISMRDRRAAG